jgi:hypothetical protein
MAISVDEAIAKAKRSANNHAWSVDEIGDVHGFARLERK